MKLLKILILGLMVILIARFVYSQGWYAIFILNTQSISTPSPFQQDIAICNGSINVGPNFAYVNNVTLFNEINSNGSNVYFVNSSGNILYSWYEGQVINGSTYCDVWWINISQGIPANSNVTIYMYIGSSGSNYYSQYYPYIGASPQVISGYDNGNYTFIAYGYFNNTFDGWSGYVYYGSPSPTATPNGIYVTSSSGQMGAYILPLNNWNIPEIPLIVEEAWYYNGGADANAISLFGNTSQQILATNIGSTCGGKTTASNLSTFVQYEYYPCNYYPNGEATMLKSAVTDQYLNYTSFPTSGGTVYSYLIVNSTYAQTGYYIYNSSQVWAPLTLLDTYPLSYNPNYGNYIYYNLNNNYNPFQYPTLEIDASVNNNYNSFQYIQWVVARAYPPNGVMPSISIQSVVSISAVQLNPSSSSSVCPGTQTSATVTVNLNNTSGTSTTVTFSCTSPSGITCSFSQNSCTTSGSSCSTTLYVSSSSSISQGSYPINITASIPGSSSQSTYTLNVGPILIYGLSTSNIQNSYTGCVYYGIIQLQATIQPININTTYGPIGNNLEFSLDYPEYILTLNITNIGNITLNNITINLQQLGNVPEILYNQNPIQLLNNINIDQLQPNQSYILQFNVLPLYIGSSSLILNFNVNGQNIGNAQYNLIVNGPSNNSSLIASENINYILILLGIIGSIIFLI